MLFVKYVRHECGLKNLHDVKQGRIHDYRSCVRVGRGGKRLTQELKKDKGYDSFD